MHRGDFEKSLPGHFSEKPRVKPVIITSFDRAKKYLSPSSLEREGLCPRWEFSSHYQVAVK